MGTNYKIIYEDITKKNKDIKNIEALTHKDLLNTNKLEFNIDFAQMKESNYKKIIKKFKKFQYKNTLLTIIYVFNYKDNKITHQNFMYAITAIMYRNYKLMYEYIYDKVCDYLDDNFYSKNLCDFKNDHCGEKKDATVIGCCRHYKHKLIGPLIINAKLITCEYLKNKRCTAKCISCKLFTCDYLRKKGIKFNIKDIFLLDTFFNPIQKYILKISVYTPKDIIIKRLLLYK